MKCKTGRDDDPIDRFTQAGSQGCVSKVAFRSANDAELRYFRGAKGDYLKV